MDDGAMGEINLDFAMDEINGPQAFRLLWGKRTAVPRQPLLAPPVPAFPRVCSWIRQLARPQAQADSLPGPAQTAVGRYPKLRGPPRSFPSVWVTSAAYSINNPGLRPRPEDSGGATAIPCCPSSLVLPSMLPATLLPSHGGPHCLAVQL